MTVYIDISQLDKTRANTGIQRVVKEFLQRIDIPSSITYKVLSYDVTKEKMEEIDISEIKPFIQNPQNYIFTTKKEIDIFNFQPKETAIYFDLDSAWSVPLLRNKLYPSLVKNGFVIANFIYDLIPILLPQYAHEHTVKVFANYFDALFKYSSLVFFDSISAQNDFNEYKKSQNITRNIPLRTVHLGSDFFKSDTIIQNSTFLSLFQKKYILFVGTIEPRKGQNLVLEVFDELASKYSDLSLVFIGKQGWKVDKLIAKIGAHPLLNKQFFWFNDIDDDTLNHFYQNAFIVTYLSAYEGYGLPIAESLNFGNITIASNNSSMYEVGRDCADYVNYETKNELYEIIALYLDNPDLYTLKKQFISKNYIPTSWDISIKSIMDVFQNYEKASNLRVFGVQKLPFVFISIDFENLQGTIDTIDKYIDFVEQYIIVTSPKMLQSFQNLKSIHKITLIDEVAILGEFAKDFENKDHLQKNWLLRASLLHLETLSDNFIMLDDDNRPLQKIDLETFINKDGTYNCYYFYELLKWHHTSTEYDKGQQNMKDIFSKQNLELYSYSSHAPQIMNKKLFKEAVDNFFQIGLTYSIDEWSTYFNYSVSNYPTLFQKKIYQTLNWPMVPSSFSPLFTQEKILFENYYKEAYSGDFFSENDTFERKLQIKSSQLEPYIKSNTLYQKIKPYLAQNNMVHGITTFKTQNREFYLSSIPYSLMIEPNAYIRLPINTKITNPNAQKFTFCIVVFLNGKYWYETQRVEASSAIYQECIIELPIASIELTKNIYELSFAIQIDNNPPKTKSSNNILKLIVDESENFQTMIGKDNPVSSSQTPYKEKLKKIPLLGWFLRWSNNLLRLNNLKHLIFTNIQRIEQLEENTRNTNKTLALLHKTIQIQKETITHLQQENQFNHQIILNHINKIEEKIPNKIEEKVANQITNQVILLHHKVDLFLKDIAKNPKEHTKNPQTSPIQLLVDDYYLAFENLFRGSRELILKRSQEYLKYLKEDTSTLLDIACGRGEWIEILQKKGLEAYGVDSNSAMLLVAQNQGVKNLIHQDAFEYIEQIEDNFFDAVTSFHFIEHISLEGLLTLLTQIKRITKPKGLLLLETPNPQNLEVASYEFYKDPTHKNPLPATVIKFMLEYLGFENVNIIYLHPVDETNQKPTPQEAGDYLIVATNGK